MKFGTAITLSLAVLAGPAMAVDPGVVVSPWVTVEGQPDSSDLGRFAQFFKDKGLAGQDLAIALWRQLCGTETGIYHFNQIFEGRENDYALGNSRDPLKNMNVHNHGFCGIQGPVLEGVFEAAGFQARSFSVPAWDHVATEVFYDGAWHYFDLDLRGTLLRKDGVIASAAEAATQKELWASPPEKIEPFFPKIQPKETGYRKFSAQPLDLQYHWAVRGWTTDHVLRPGESLTRWWRNQDGRWHHDPSYTGWMRTLLEKEPRGIKPNNAEFSIWGVGSTLMRYTPDLTDKSRDVELGAYSISNLKTSAKGLTPIAEEDGRIIFEVHSPYIIVPIMDDLDNPDNFDLNRDAATVMVKATSPVEAEISTNGGRTWTNLGQLTNGARLDLTRYVRGTYGYLVRMTLRGTPGEAILRSLELRTWGQVAPISIPRLAQGNNMLHLGVNDPRSRATRLVPVLPDLGVPADIDTYGIKVAGTYTPDDVKQRLVGTAVVPVQAPPGELIEWLSVGGMFQALRGKQAKQTANKIEIATSADGPFKTVYDASGSVPDWNEHWHYAMDVEVPLDKPVPAVYVRYVGNPGCNAIRIYAHCSDPRPSNTGLVRITHTYDIADERFVRSFDVPASGGSYNIECPAAPTNVSVMLTVPHASAAKPASVAR
jgi:hypothetical protein